jgi:hypothetical protein
MDTDDESFNCVNILLYASTLRIVSNVFTPSMAGIIPPPSSVGSLILLQEIIVKSSEEQTSKANKNLLITEENLNTGSGKFLGL